MKRRTYQMAISLVFVLFILLFFLLACLLPVKDFSELENRYLAKPPALTLENVLEGKFSEEAETYITDYFPFREYGAAAHTLLLRMSGRQEVGGVYFGTDGALYQHADPADEAQLAGNIAAAARFAEEAGVPVTIALIPTAAAVYADRLPTGAPVMNQRAVSQRILAGIPEAQGIDLYDTLDANREAPVFYRTDHHWTSYGAFYAYRTLMQAWNMPSIMQEQLEPQAVSQNFYGTLARAANTRWIARDTITRLYEPEGNVFVLDSGAPELGVFYDASMLETTDQYRYFLSGSHALVRITGMQKDGEKLLVLRDSFADSIAPFLVQSFAEVHLADLRYMKYPMTQYIEEHGIDRVLVLYAVPNFAHDTNLHFLR